MHRIVKRKYRQSWNNAYEILRIEGKGSCEYLQWQVPWRCSRSADKCMLRCDRSIDCSGTGKVLRIDSRPAEDNSSIRRRRSCDECGKRFTTYEKVETIPLIVIKKDNNREQYERAKIENGVLNACYKRPVPAEEIQKTIDAIELSIFNREEKEIPSSEIGEIVMENLKALDPVAYVRFASVYREFKDANTFMDELKKFLK